MFEQTGDQDTPKGPIDSSLLLVLFPKLVVLHVVSMLDGKNLLRNVGDLTRYLPQALDIIALVKCPCKTTPKSSDEVGSMVLTG